MKSKKAIVMLLALALLFVLTGCAVEEKLDALEDRVEERIDVVEDSMLPNQSLQTTSSPELSGAAELTKEQAEQIALEHVGLSADQVRNLYTRYEMDDGIPQYEVEFREGIWEYEFEIHAETGKILSYDKDD